MKVRDNVYKYWNNIQSTSETVITQCISQVFRCGLRPVSAFTVLHSTAQVTIGCEEKCQLWVLSHPKLPPFCTTRTTPPLHDIVSCVSKYPPQAPFVPKKCGCRPPLQRNSEWNYLILKMLKRVNDKVRKPWVFKMGLTPRISNLVQQLVSCTKIFAV